MPSNREIDNMVVLPTTAAKTASSGRPANVQRRIDSILGKPPAGLDRTARARWYRVASQYPSIRPSARPYLEIYISTWTDCQALEQALDNIEDPLERMSHRAQARVLALRKHMTTVLGQMRTSLKGKV